MHPCLQARAWYMEWNNNWWKSIFNCNRKISVECVYNLYICDNKGLHNGCLQDHWNWAFSSGHAPTGCVHTWGHRADVWLCRTIMQSSVFIYGLSLHAIWLCGTCVYMYVHALKRHSACHSLLSCTRFKDRVFLTNLRARKLLALFAKGVPGHGMDPTMFQEMLLEIASPGLKDLHAFLGEWGQQVLNVIPMHNCMHVFTCNVIRSHYRTHI